MKNISSEKMRVSGEKSLISVIIPVYNAEMYLRECLDSILNQTFSGWKCICIDDGSVDSSPKILDEYAAKDLRFIVRHKANEGVTSARKLGVSLADTDFLCFVDSDDRLPPDALERLIEHQKKTGAEVVRGNFSFDKNGSLKDFKLPESAFISRISEGSDKIYHTTNGEKFFPICLRYCSLCATLYDSRIFQTSNHFPDNRVILGEDGLTLFSILFQTEKMVFVDDIVYWYRDNENGCSNKLYSDAEKELKADIDFTVELVKLIKRFPEKKCHWLKYYVVDNIYGKFIRTQYFQENKITLQSIYTEYFCRNISVQYIVWKFNWKKWVKMWLACRKMF